MLYGIAVFLFVLTSIMLMGIILLQSSKTGGMGSAMGGQAMNAAFGGHGADKLLVRITSGLAVTFMVLAICIGMMDNPASRIDTSSEPTIGRQSSAVAEPIITPLDLEPLTAPVENAISPSTGDDSDTE